MSPVKLLSFVLLIPLTSFSQQKAGVWGRVKQEAFKTIWLYSDYFHGPATCKLNFATAIPANRSVYYIIGDTICDRQNRSFIVFHENSRYMLDVKDLANVTEVEGELKKIIASYPSINERELQAAREIPIELAKIDEEEIKIKLEEEKRAKRELDSLHKVLDKTLKQYSDRNWVLWNWSWSYSSEYSKFIDIDITVINPFKKKIKYLWFSFAAFNPVDDPVKDGITGKLEKTVQGIGPIEYGEKGTYNFEDVFYSNVIQTMRVNQIKIQFFDGTIKVISRPYKIKKDELE